jgi:hypothetical protein
LDLARSLLDIHGHNLKIWRQAMEQLHTKLDDLSSKLEIIVEVIKQMATKDDLEQLRAATKDDLEQLREQMATKDDLEQLRAATKDDLEQLREQMATKDDLEQLREQMATKDDLEQLREQMATKRELGDIRREMSTKQDIAELRQDYCALRWDLSNFREQNHREHLHLYHVLREELWARTPHVAPGDPA